MTPILLKTDQVWGVFACVAEADADSLCDTLTEAHIRFATDLEEAARVADRRPDQLVSRLSENRRTVSRPR